MTAAVPHLLVVALVALSAEVLAADPPPVPDAKRYPELAAMRAWLDTASPQAQHCLWSAGLFHEADALYRANKSEPKTIEAMMRKHGEKVKADQRERLRQIVTGVTAMASGLATLDADSAPVAYSQLCIGRAQKGGELSTAALKARFDASQKCELAHRAGSLARKECVAAAFRMK